MSRVIGQIDQQKNEAILDAAIELFLERGIAAPVEEIARRAHVSKQTVYNHYGSKAALARAISERRSHEIREVFSAPGALENPGETLARYARLLLEAIQTPRGMALYRMAIQAASAMPEVGRAFYEAGPRFSRVQLAGYLCKETAAGRLHAPDPMEAAEFFVGMVAMRYHTPMLMGIEPALGEAEIGRVAREASMRFLKAFAP
jgi:AcrR family transcriptional regulator